MVSLIADASLASEILHKCKAGLIIVTFEIAAEIPRGQKGSNKEAQAAIPYKDDQK